MEAYPIQMIKLASEPKNVSRIEKFVQRVLADLKLSDEVFANILISVTEAVTNAITHGNQSDKSKMVHVAHSRKNQFLVFKITDEGKGFDYQNLPDPTTPDNLLKLGGRGVFLMRQLSDQVSFSNNGSTVEILFRI